MIPSIMAVIILGFAVLLLSGCKKPAEISETLAPAITVKKVKSLSKVKLLEMLANIESQDAPLPKMGAMCYEVAAPPQRVEYVCPICSEKTLYTDDNTYVISMDLQTCRREIEQIKKISELEITLDESTYCRKCSPDVKKPALVLNIKYADGTTHTKKDVSSHHLRVLRDFLKGNLSYETFNDGTYPLKNEAPRLRRLLGLENKDTK